MADVMGVVWDDLEKLEEQAILGAKTLADSFAAQGYFR